MTAFTHTQQPKDNLIGRQVGNLRILEQVGQGGFGVVYRAINVTLGTPAAVKVLRTQATDNKDVLERFRREATLVAKLDHPNVVRVLDYGEIDGRYYLAMDFLKGHSLKELILQKQRFSIKEIRILMEKICSTLQYLHQKGIVHRDLKPANLFLQQSKRGKSNIKILDFGVAAISDSQTITVTGAPIGSPIYMPPEQARGDGKNVDGRADIYSLAVILYEMLTGIKPFQGGGFAAVLLKHLTEPPPTLQRSTPHIPWSRKLEDLIQHSMAKEPEDRPRDAESFFQMLSEALAEQATLFPDGTFPPYDTTTEEKAVLFALELDSQIPAVEETLRTPLVTQELRELPSQSPHLEDTPSPNHKVDWLDRNESFDADLSKTPLPPPPPEPGLWGDSTTVTPFPPLHRASTDQTSAQLKTSDILSDEHSPRSSDPEQATSAPSADVATPSDELLSPKDSLAATLPIQPELDFPEIYHPKEPTLTKRSGRMVWWIGSILLLSLLALFLWSNNTTWPKKTVAPLPKLQHPTGKRSTPTTQEKKSAQKSQALKPATQKTPETQAPHSKQDAPKSTTSSPSKKALPKGTPSRPRRAIRQRPPARLRRRRKVRPKPKKRKPQAASQDPFGGIDDPI